MITVNYDGDETVIITMDDWDAGMLINDLFELENNIVNVEDFEEAIDLYRKLTKELNK